MVSPALQGILSWEPRSQDDLEFFRRIPWCAQLLASPDVKPYTGSTPIGNARGMDPVVNGFMSGEGGILRHTTLLAASHVFPKLDPAPSDPTLSRDPNGDGPDYPIHIHLFHLGRALQGVPPTIHGGVLALLADSVLSMTALLHRDPQQQGYSAYANIRFAKPVFASSDGTATILVKSQISHRSHGGKIVVLASFEGPNGVIYATAESLLVVKKWKGKL
jgi:acyl-coenzyme A thioesterase PaaI-like protein